MLHNQISKGKELILNDSNELLLMKQDVHKSVHKNSKTPDYHAFVSNEISVIWVKIELRVIIELNSEYCSFYIHVYARLTLFNPTNSTVNVCISHNPASSLLQFTWKLIEYSSVAKSPSRNIKRI